MGKITLILSLTLEKITGNKNKTQPETKNKTGDGWCNSFFKQINPTSPPRTFLTIGNKEEKKHGKKAKQ